MKKNLHLLLLTGVFAIAMAFLESAVVVYLRYLYYPEGFAFPLKVLDDRIVVTEILREAATMVMLFMIALIAQKGTMQRFAIFIYAFAIWDIFYYVFLYSILSWPPSLFTWDILFLIPVTWTGPVMAPVINSLTMILLSVLVISSGSKKESFRLTRFEWALLIFGSILTIAAYTQPYLHHLLERFTFRELLRFNPTKEMMDYSLKFIPQQFNWLLFGAAEMLFLFVIGRIFLRVKPGGADQHPG